MWDVVWKSGKVFTLVKTLCIRQDLCRYRIGCTVLVYLLFYISVSAFVFVYFIFMVKCRKYFTKSALFYVNFWYFFENFYYCKMLTTYWCVSFFYLCILWYNGYWFLCVNAYKSILSLYMGWKSQHWLAFVVHAFS